MLIAIHQCNVYFINSPAPSTTEECRAIFKSHLLEIQQWEFCDMTDDDLTDDSVCYYIVDDQIPFGEAMQLVYNATDCYDSRDEYFAVTKYIKNLVSKLGIEVKSDE